MPTCPHDELTASGSNQHQTKMTCKKCGHLVFSLHDDVSPTVVKLKMERWLKQHRYKLVPMEEEDTTQKANSSSRSKSPQPEKDELQNQIETTRINLELLQCQKRRQELDKKMHDMGKIRDMKVAYQAKNTNEKVAEDGATEGSWNVCP